MLFSACAGTFKGAKKRHGVADFCSLCCVFQVRKLSLAQPVLGRALRPVKEPRWPGGPGMEQNLAH